MGMTQAEVLAAVRSEAGEGESLISDPDIVRWFNEGQAEFAPRQQKVTLYWEESQPFIELPADFRVSDDARSLVLEPLVPADWLFPADDLRPHDAAGTTNVMPANRIWGKQLQFIADNGAPYEGVATLTYWAEWPKLTPTQDTELPTVGDRACISYCLYRFLSGIANSPVQYRRYSQLVTVRNAAGAQAPTVEDLQAEADRRYQEFQAGKIDVEDQMEAALFFSEG